MLTGIEGGNYQKSLSEQSEDSDRELCPNCHNDQTVNMTWSWKLAFLLHFIYAIPIPFVYNKVKCTKCKHNWKTHVSPYPASVIAITIVMFGAVILIVFALWFFWCRLHGSIATFI